MKRGLLEQLSFEAYGGELDFEESEVKIFCSKNILGILGFSSVIAVVALLALGLTQNKPLPENVKFGIVLDAGSSHTNLYIYKWPAEKENDTGVVTQIEECKVKGPGISEFAQKLNEIDIYLTACMERARKVIPTSQHTETPVYLGATAGMRLLRMENERLADKILAAVANSISSYPFDFQGARIITGQEEGAYGWITINYLLGRFTQKLSWFNLKPSEGDTQETYGALDLGGASTQITFVPRNETTESSNTALHFRLYGKNYGVYTHSFLCYGKDQALLQKLSKDLQASAFSAFYYVMEFLNLTSEEQSTHKKMINTLEKFCSRPWEEVRSTSVGWTLGYMLNLTNMIPSEEPLSTPLSHTTYVFLMVLFSLILVIAVIIGIFIFHKPSYFWKDMV
eukprot:bmy_11847T0